MASGRVLRSSKKKLDVSDCKLSENIDYIETSTKKNNFGESKYKRKATKNLNKLGNGKKRKLDYVDRNESMNLGSTESGKKIKILENVVIPPENENKLNDIQLKHDPIAKVKRSKKSNKSVNNLNKNGLDMVESLSHSLHFNDEKKSVKRSRISSASNDVIEDADDTPWEMTVKSRLKESQSGTNMVLRRKTKLNLLDSSNNSDKNKENLVNDSTDISKSHKPSIKLKISRRTSSSYSVDESTVLDCLEKLKQPITDLSQNIENQDLGKMQEVDRNVNEPGISSSSNEEKIEDLEQVAHTLINVYPNINLNNIGKSLNATQELDYELKKTLQNVSQNFVNMQDVPFIPNNTYISTNIQDENGVSSSENFINVPDDLTNIQPSNNQTDKSLNDCTVDSKTQIIDYELDQAVNNLYKCLEEMQGDKTEKCSFSDIQDNHIGGSSKSNISSGNYIVNKELEDCGINSRSEIHFPGDLINNESGNNQTMKSSNVELAVDSTKQETNYELEQAVEGLSRELEKLLNEEYLQNQNRINNCTNENEETGSLGISSKTFTNNLEKHEQTVSLNCFEVSSTQNINHEFNQHTIGLPEDLNKQMFSEVLDQHGHNTFSESNEIEVLNYDAGNRNSNVLMMHNMNVGHSASFQNYNQTPTQFNFAPGNPTHLQQICFKENNEDYRKTYESMGLSWSGITYDPRIQKPYKSQPLEFLTDELQHQDMNTRMIPFVYPNYQ